MRGRAAAIFALGFASGMLCLAVVLWAGGVLRRAPAAAAAIAAGASTNGTAEAVAKGGADRLIPESSPKLSMPVVGVEANRLPDTFTDKRDGRRHEALDIAAARGTPVLAAGRGSVAKLFTSREGGLTVYEFDDSGKWCYYYAHLDRYAAGLQEGMPLHVGEVIGYVGTTGNAPPNAPHLHFAVFRLGPEKKWWKGTAVDPLPLLRSGS